MAASEARASQEEQRRIPKRLLADLQRDRDWKVSGARVLDLGAGLGGLVAELMDEGADAHGIEPDVESRALAQARLRLDGHDPARILDAHGEQLPFASDSFDYVISLQVLEHVRDPERVIREMFRVLKPGGRCYISCENYLAFREQEYRVAWLPLLPKRIAATYLRLRGRDPAFLLDDVFYTTYPQIWRLSRRAGFINRTYAGHRKRWREDMAHATRHALNAFRTGVRVHLSKPGLPT